MVGEAWIQKVWREEKWAMCSYEWHNSGQSAVKLLEMHVNKCCVLIVREDYGEEIKHLHDNRYNI